MEKLIDPQTVNEILVLIELYGFVVVFFFTLLQSVGLPLPAQTVLITAGVMVGQGLGDPLYIVGFGLAGALLGSQIGYSVGSRGGRTFVLRWGRYIFITPERLERAEKLFGNRAERTVLIARFVPVLKTFGYLVAGIVLMPRIAFFRSDLLGTVVWVVASVGAGYLVSESVMAFVE